MTEWVVNLNRECVSCREMLRLSQISVPRSSFKAAFRHCVLLLCITGMALAISSAEAQPSSSSKTKKVPADTTMKTVYKNVLELDSQRNIISGSTKDLCQAIARGADLRIYTEFLYEEHIIPNSPDRGIVREVSNFRVTWLIDRRWTAGIMNLRMPVGLPGFGNQPSWSFFMYNQNGQQAIARPFLDGVKRPEPIGEVPPYAPKNMPKYHALDNFDDKSNAPCSNFIYDFEIFKFFVRDDWCEMFAHDASGKALSGSLAEFMEAFAAGADLKVGISNLFYSEGDLPSEVFLHCGPGYHHTGNGVFTMSSEPAVIVKPAIPMVYKTGNWNAGHILVSTDGNVEYWYYNPYTMEYSKKFDKCAMRYFVR